MHPISQAHRDPDQPACIDAESGQGLSYRTLNERANRGAHLLRALGLRRGDVGATLLHNCLEVFEVAWAAQRIGLYLTSISTKLSPADVGYIVDDSGARLLIGSNHLAPLCAAALQTRSHVSLLRGSLAA